MQQVSSLPSNKVTPCLKNKKFVLLTLALSLPLHYVPSVHAVCTNNNPPSNTIVICDNIGTDVLGVIAQLNSTNVDVTIAPLNAEVSATGDSILLYSNSSVINDGIITVKNGRAINLLGSNNVIVNLGKIDASQSNDIGIFGNPTSINNDITNSGTIISTAGTNVRGIQFTDDQQKIKNSGTIDLAGAGDYGIIAKGLNIISSTDTIKLGDFAGTGIYVDGPNNQITNDGTITLLGSDSYGIRAIPGSFLNVITNNGTILLNAKNSRGIESDEFIVGNNQFTNNGLIKSVDPTGPDFGIVSYSPNNVVTNSNLGTIDLIGNASSAIQIAGDNQIVLNDGTLKISGNNSYAIRALSGLNSKFTNTGSILMFGASSIGINSNDDSNISINKGLIQSNNTNGFGLAVAFSNNKLTNELGGTIDLQAFSTGIVASGNNEILINNGTINVGQNSYGVRSLSGANNTLTNNGSIFFTANSSVGMEASDTVNGNNTLINNGLIQDNAGNGVGLSVSISSNNTLTNASTGTINLPGASSTGIFILGGANQTIINDGVIQLGGAGSYGVRGLTNFNASTINNNNLIKMTNTGSIGISMDNLSAVANNKIFNNAQIQGTGNGEFGIVIRGGTNQITNLADISLTGPASTGLYNESNNNIFLNSSNIKLTGASSYGIRSFLNGINNTFTNDSLIQLDGDNSFGIAIEGLATTVSNNKVINNANILLNGKNSFGGFITQGGVTFDNNKSILLNGINSTGVSSAGNGNILTNNDDIVLPNTSGIGVNLTGLNNKFTNNDFLSLAGNSSKGVIVGINSLINDNDLVTNNSLIELTGPTSTAVQVLSSKNTIDNKSLIRLTAISGIGVEVFSNNNTITNEDTILLTKTGGIGISIASGMNNLVNNQNTISLLATGVGISVGGTNNKINNNKLISLVDVNSIGISVNGDTNIITNNQDISLTNTGSKGFFVQTGKSGNLITNNSLINLSATNSFGGVINGSNNIFNNNDTVNLTADNSTGVAIGGDSNTVTNIDTIALVGANSSGVSFSGNTNIIDNQMIISVTGLGSHGISSTGGTNNTIYNSNKITSTNLNGNGINLNGILGNKNTIINKVNGLIQSAQNIGIFESNNGQTVFIDNAGTISGITKSVLLGTGDDTLILRKTGVITTLADGGGFNLTGNNFIFDNWTGVLGNVPGKLNITNWQNVTLQNSSSIDMGSGTLDQASVTKLVIEENSILNADSGGGTGFYKFKNAIVYNDGIISLSNGANGDRLGISGFAVNGLIGTKGIINLDVKLDVSHSVTDRLLLVGDVDPTLEIPVFVSNVGGIGAITGNTSSDGISIIQVLGKSTASSFKLGNPGEYVAVGPYQYKLYFFEKVMGIKDENPEISFAIPTGLSSDPAELDPLFVQLGMIGPFNDYRLQSVLVDGVPVVIPQVEVEQVLTTSFFQANHAIFGSYFERIRNSKPDDHPTKEKWSDLVSHFTQYQQPANNGLLDEFFVRVGGDRGSYKIDSNTSSFKERLRFIQAGSNIVSDDYMGGIAFTYAKQTIDSNFSSAKGHLKIYDISLPITYDNGNYVDFVPHGSYNRARVHSAERGQTGETDGWNLGLNLESGIDLRLPHDIYVIPQIYIAYNHVWFKDFTDVDNTYVTGLKRNSLVGKVGAHLEKEFSFQRDKSVAPYISAHWVNEFLSKGIGVNVANVDFKAPPVGSSLELVGGIKIQIKGLLGTFVQAKYSTPLEHKGFKGWSGLAGLRLEM